MRGHCSGRFDRMNFYCWNMYSTIIFISNYVLPAKEFSSHKNTSFSINQLKSVDT